MNFYKYPVTDIPPIFYPYKEVTPFSNCISCDRYLLDNDVEYIIEKAMRCYPEYASTDVIFEYAMCMACAEKMRQELSKDSLARIQDFMQHNSRLMEQSQRLISENNWKVDDWISNCAINGASIEEQEEYQLFAHCRGNQMILSVMPYMVSGAAIEQMAELLSPKTRDELNRFIDDNFGIPPELKMHLKDQPIMFI